MQFYTSFMFQVDFLRNAALQRHPETLSHITANMKADLIGMLHHLVPRMAISVHFHEICCMIDYFNSISLQHPGLESQWRGSKVLPFLHEARSRVGETLLDTRPTWRNTSSKGGASCLETICQKRSAASLIAINSNGES